MSWSRYPFYQTPGQVISAFGRAFDRARSSASLWHCSARSEPTISRRRPNLHRQSSKSHPSPPSECLCGQLLKLRPLVASSPPHAHMCQGSGFRGPLRLQFGRPGRHKANAARRGCKHMGVVQGTAMPCSTRGTGTRIPFTYWCHPWCIPVPPRCHPGATPVLEDVVTLSAVNRTPTRTTRHTYLAGTRLRGHPRY